MTKQVRATFDNFLLHLDLNEGAKTPKRFENYN